MSTGWLFRHLGLRAWSLALAVGLWTIVAGEQTVERGLRVPLELQQFPSGLELRADAPSLIDVRVRGSSGTLSRVVPGDIVGVLDLRAARAGVRLFQLTPEQVRVPVGVEVVQVTPASIALSFENALTRDVPVVPAIEGSPAPGFFVESLASDPTTIAVVGPESAVTRVTEATTEPISIAGATQDVTVSVPVGFLDPSVRAKAPRPASVRVRIVPGPAERALLGRAVHLRGAAPSLLAQSVPASVDVVLRGTTQSLALLKPDAIVAFVDLAGLGTGEYTLGVQVDTLQGAGVARITPETVTVRITSAK